MPFFSPIVRRQSNKLAFKMYQMHLNALPLSLRMQSNAIMGKMMIACQRHTMALVQECACISNICGWRISYPFVHVLFSRAHNSTHYIFSDFFFSLFLGASVPNKMTLAIIWHTFYNGAVGISVSIAINSRLKRVCVIAMTRQKWNLLLIIKIEGIFFITFL